MTAEKKEKMFLAPDVILGIIAGTQEEAFVETLLSKASAGELEVITSQAAFYEALACVEKAEIDIHRLVQFVESVKLISDPEELAMPKQFSPMRADRRLKLRRIAKLEKEPNGKWF